MGRLEDKIRNYDLAQRERNNKPVDEPPATLGKSWQNVTSQQMRRVINTLFKALDIRIAQSLLKA